MTTGELVTAFAEEIAVQFAAGAAVQARLRGAWALLAAGTRVARGTRAGGVICVRGKKVGW